MVEVAVGLSAIFLAGFCALLFLFAIALAVDWAATKQRPGWGGMVMMFIGFTAGAHSLIFIAVLIGRGITGG